MSKTWKPGPTILGALLGMGLIAAALAFVMPRRNEVQAEANARDGMRAVVNALNVYVENYGEYPKSLKKLKDVDTRVPAGFVLKNPTARGSYVYAFSGSCLEGARSGTFKYEWDPAKYWVISTAGRDLYQEGPQVAVDRPDAVFNYETTMVPGKKYLSAYMDGRIEHSPVFNNFMLQCSAYNGGARKIQP